MFDAAFQILDMVMGAASGEIKKKVKTWNLENQDLLYTLGYIAGFLDATYQTLPGRNEYNERTVEILFLKAIKRYLIEIDGADNYLEMALTTFQHGGSDIGGMQIYPIFLDAMKDGGNCYIDTLNGKAAARFKLFLRLLGEKM